MAQMNSKNNHLALNPSNFSPFFDYRPRTINSAKKRKFSFTNKYNQDKL